MGLVSISIFYYTDITPDCLSNGLVSFICLMLSCGIRL